MIDMTESSTIKNQEIELASTIASNIINKLDHVPPALPNTYICKVHQELRMHNEKAYEPVLLSIGPYHYSKRACSLRCMEEHKLRYLNQLIERVEKHRGIPKACQLNCFLIALTELEDKARAYYAEAITLNKHKFIEMMLLDGCFIIELFNRWSWNDFVDPLFKVGRILNSLSRDLILIENQVPFFVLKKLHSMIFDEPGLLHPDLHLICIALTFLPIYSHLPLAQSSDERLIGQQSINYLSAAKSFTMSLEFKVLDSEEVTNIKHLLDLVHKFMLIEEILEMKPMPNEGAGEMDTFIDIRGPTDKIDSLWKSLAYSATELSNLGVRFKGIKKGRFYDIKFEHGVLEIPIISVYGGTEAVFQNLIAYEENGRGHNAMYIADYMIFMNGLINSPKDVKLLSQLGIINHFGLDDKAVLTMFRRMTKKVRTSIGSYYEDCPGPDQALRKEKERVEGGIKKTLSQQPVEGSVNCCSLCITHGYSTANCLHSSFYHNK